ncbi:MAG: nickel-responsive transcriptional regulator NikR [Planctomycetes bacterium]|nr:nickel-responsive transcriptional regulator NikR [Planctomycetota bacterium]
MIQAPSTPNLTRFSVSLPADLLDRLDAMVARRNLPSRSGALAEMIEHQLVEHEHPLGSEVVAGTITIVYRSNRGLIRNELAQVQRRYLKETISSQHVFLEHDHSLEVLLVQGPAKKLKSLSDQISAIKGVKQVRLAVTAHRLPPLH